MKIVKKTLIAALVLAAFTTTGVAQDNASDADDAWFKDMKSKSCTRSIDNIKQTLKNIKGRLALYHDSVYTNYNDYDSAREDIKYSREILISATEYCEETQPGVIAEMTKKIDKMENLIKAEVKNIKYGYRGE